MQSCIVPCIDCVPSQQSTELQSSTSVTTAQREGRTRAVLCFVGVARARTQGLFQCISFSARSAYFEHLYKLLVAGRQSGSQQQAYQKLASQSLGSCAEPCCIVSCCMVKPLDQGVVCLYAELTPARQSAMSQGSPQCGTICCRIA